MLMEMIDILDAQGNPTGVVKPRNDPSPRIGEGARGEVMRLCA